MENQMMLLRRFICGILIFMGWSALAQLPPPDPFFQLDTWSFDDTNWLSDLGYAPASFTNLNNPPSFDGNALQVDSTNAAWLQYHILEDDGSTNLVFNQGTIELWVLPDWNSGTGPGDWGRLIDVGAYSTNNPSSWWSLYFSPDGTSLYFSSETNGVYTNYLNYPISWDTNTWHFIALTWRRPWSELYVDGQLATNGAGMSYVPGAEVVSNGFYVGSDNTGWAQSRVQMDDLATYNYALNAEDVSNDYAAGLQLMGGSHPDDGPGFPGGGFGGGGGGGGGYTNYIDYGTNLWIAQVNISSNNFMAIASNTVADVQYEIQSLTDLTQTNWVSQGFILGSGTTNWTPLNPLAVSRTNNFFIRIKSWADDGSGLPIWWQEQYFGTTGVDPDALDSAGDGYTIWQKFQMGLNPNVFYYPRSPQGVVASLNPTNSIVTVTWQPSYGAVTGYTIVRYDVATNGFGAPSPTSYNVGLTNKFVDTNLPAYTEGDFEFVSAPDYVVEADYANGGFDSDSASPYSSTAVPSVLEMPGAEGATTLVVTHIPPGVSSIELERSDLGTNLYSPLNGLPEPTLVTPAVYADYPVSDFTNGIFAIPTNMIYTALPDGSSYHLQAIWPDGSKSAAVAAGSPEVPFYDGRAQLEQNVSFLLRAATLTNAFSYVLDNPSDYQVNQPNTYTYASYYDAYTDGYGNYYSGLGDFSGPDWRRPFVDGYNYRNFIYGDNTNLDSSGFLNTGCSSDGEGNYTLLDNPVFQFAVPTNGMDVPSPGQSVYSPPYTDETRLGMYVNGSSQFVLPNNIYNYFGLHLSSVLLAHNHAGTLYLDSLSAGGTWPETNDSYYFYPRFDSPELETVGYYFGRIVNFNTVYDSSYVPIGDPMPGTDNFTTNTPQPLIIVGMDGLPVQFAAFAKKIITNGDTTKPVYVAQYFDKAYKVDASGNVSSTQTGVLSPWGRFFPTEPGAVALVTMPDIDTGERGTNIIYVVSLALDANHDGVMDLSYFGEDQVSSFDTSTWFKFWINDGYTQPGANGSLDQDVPLYPNLTSYANTNVQPNYLYGQIRCNRNLENFARLWVCGLPQFPANHGYTVSLGFDPAEYTGINLYPAVETNGGTQYLTDTNVAAAQISAGYLKGHALNFGNQLATIGSYYDANLQDYMLPLDSGGQPWLTNFLFEGSGIGEGNMILTVFQSNNIIAQAVANINIDTIENYYEQATVTNVVQTWPEMVQTNKTSGFAINNLPAYYSPYDAQQQAVFVHGWKMSEWDYEDFSDLMFKRLYWQGYQGRFASLRWPTRSTDTDTNLLFGGLVPSVDFTYNRSEHIAFESGAGTAAYLNNLRQREPNFTISACSHSMGGIVMMEALKELAASNQAPLYNYVLMQAAVPAQCYDTTITNYPLFTLEESVVPTPNTYSNYGAEITNALRGGAINFYNPVDFALQAWQLNEGFYITSSDGPLTIKPNTFFGYSYNPTNTTSQVTTNGFQALFGATNVQIRVVSDPLELMPFVARPRSLSVGAQGGVGNVLKVGREINLQSTLGFTADTYDHSGQFNRNIQTPQVQGFYDDLLSTLFLQNP